MGFKLELKKWSETQNHKESKWKMGGGTKEKKNYMINPGVPTFN